MWEWNVEVGKKYFNDKKKDKKKKEVLHLVIGGRLLQVVIGVVEK